MLEKNKIYHGDCLDYLKLLPDKSINLIVIDPPYNTKKAEWDKWDSIAEYIDWCGLWLKESQRVLKDDGSFYFFHNDFLQIVELQNYINNNTDFIFKQLIVWDKFNGGKSGDKGRVEKGKLNYPKQAEYILFYTRQKGNEPNGHESVRKYITQERGKINKTLTEINRECFNINAKNDGMAGNILSPYKKGWSFPTKEKYNILKNKYNIFDIPYEVLKNKLQYIKPYTFNCQKYSSVIQAPPEKPEYHITQKPIKLLEILIKTSSNKGDTVLDFFSGSATTAIACKKLGRDFICVEKDLHNFEISINRFKIIGDGQCD